MKTKPLAKENIQDIIALTPMQEGLLFHYLTGSQWDHYCEQLTLELAGDIREDMFKQAWQAVVDANPMLRTLFRWEKVEQPVQIILKEHTPEIYFHDLSAPESGNAAQRFEAVKTEEKRRGFDLRRVPFRVTLCKMTANTARMIIGNHHILYDGWSNGVLLEEFFTHYRCLTEGLPAPKVARGAFKEYVQWVRKRDLEKEAAYWRGYLEGVEGGTRLPFNRAAGGITPPAAEPADIRHYESHLDATLKTEIDGFLKGAKSTLAALIYTAWGLLLQRYLDSPDVLFGITLSGRSAKVAEIEKIVGLFINTLPLRVTTGPGDTVETLLTRTSKALRQKETVESTSLASIRDYCKLENQEELFDTLVVIENYPLDTLLLKMEGSLKAGAYHMEERTHYHLTLGVTVLFDRIETLFSYDAGLLDPGAVERMAGHFKNITRAMLDEPSGGAASLDFLTEGERKQVLREFNDTQAPYRRDVVIHRIFEEQAAKYPDAVALSAPEREVEEPGYRFLTYRELDRRANRLARTLRGRGCGPDRPVGLLVERSLEMMIGIFAVLKAGGAYLPIDPGYPPHRTAFVLADSGADVLLTFPPFGQPAESFGGTMLNLCAEAVFHPDDTAPDTGVQPTHLAYLIYTSGSTGKPKGAMLQHRSLVNRLNWMQKAYPIGPGHTLLQKTPYTFDVSVWEIIWWSLHGASLCCLIPGGEKDPAGIVRTIQHRHITVMHFVPSMLNAFLEFIATANAVPRLASLRQVIASGEALTVAQVELFNRLLYENHGTRLANLYGPTEATIDVSYFDCSTGGPFETIPIGKPIDNTQLLIVDSRFRPQPVGVPGELCIGGDNLARGYLNRPELTHENFVCVEGRGEKGEGRKKQDGGSPPHFEAEGPLSSPLSPLPSPLYKTGDLARWMPDGNIEYLGRIDFQVKIRGFRIELGEIESLLSSHPDVREAVVVARKGGDGENFLCGYYVSAKELPPEDLKAHLSARLPGYMAPSFYFRLEALPLTASGKINRRALPEPEAHRPGLRETFVAPRDDLEQVIAGAWKGVLKIDGVGVNDNFFDLGGNSLTLIRLSGRLQKELGKEVPVVALFNHSTVAAQARFFSGAEAVETAEAAEAAETPDGLPPSQQDPDIAVIGMAGRFPGAAGIQRFWRNIREGVESITFFSPEELQDMGIEPQLAQAPNFVPAKGVLRDIEYFDAEFFGYSAREAEMMDPQLRLLHQCVYHALEDAGIDPARYNGDIGLYAGAYSPMQWMRQVTAGITTHSEQLGIGSLTDREFLSTRISYRLNLRGPGLTVQTACSTSLTAIDAACQALLTRKCHVAMAGGVTVTFQDRGGYLYEDGMIRTPDGHCRPFDHRAKGTVGGNGVAVVVLKPLAAALADGDHIYAVVKGSAVNNDGSRKVGYTAPSVEGQAQAIRSAQRMGGIDPETVTYIETHGTGTPLGDPVEIEALKQAFKTRKRQYCRLGAVKANIGHLDAGAGAAGFIKAVLCLKHRTLPPLVNFEAPNPSIDFDDSPFYLAGEATPWQTEGFPRRAGVSSFGIGGTNAHVVLEEAPPTEPAPGGPGRKQKLVLLSARGQDALDRSAFNLASRLRDNPGLDLGDVAFTLQTGRGVFAHRRMMVGETAREIADALSDPNSAAVATAHTPETGKHIVFMFSGQGSQYVNMGRRLYETEPLFRRELDGCFDILKSLGCDLKPALYPPAGQEGQGHGAAAPGLPDINRTAVTQPVIFSFEYALARLLMSWGIRPHAMIGHSIGEYTAACLAGVFSLHDALKVVTERGRLMQALPAGSMLSVPYPCEEVEPMLDRHPELSLAADNSSSLCVVAGPDDAVDAFAKQLEQQGKAVTRLHTSHAFHSAMMDPMLAPFEEVLKAIQLHPPKMPYISNAGGEWITREQACGPGYWVRHVRNAVRFSPGLARLLEDPKVLLVEVGPGRALTTFARKHGGRKEEQAAFNLVRHPRDAVSDDRFLLQNLGRLWMAGAGIDWAGFYDGQKRRRVPLPGYSFDRRYYWKFGQLVERSTGASTPPAAPDDQKETPGMETGADGRHALDRWFYRCAWGPSPRTPGYHPSKIASAGWLIFTVDSPVVNKLEEKLKQAGGGRVTLVKQGSQFVRLSEGVYTLNPTDPAGYEILLKALSVDNRPFGRVVHCWNFDGVDEPGAPVQPVLDTGFYSLLHFARATAKQGLARSLTLTVLTGGLQPSGRPPVIAPVRAVLLGACRVLPKEYPQLRCRGLDIAFPPGETEGPSAPLVEQWAAELALDAGDDGFQPLVAYHGALRRLPRFETMTLESPQDLPAVLRPQGVYLVTGGLGGIGMVLAEHLARRVEARLVLTGRTPMPPREAWEDLASQTGEDQPLAARVRQCLLLEKLGAQVLPMEADVADPDAMGRVWARAVQQFGNIDGVIHAAGVPEGGVIQAKTRAEAEAVMDPKVRGTLVLDELIGTMEPENAPKFMVLCSSVTAELGAFGQVAYTAANAFLDYYALWRRGGNFPTPVVSINWDTWQEVGMAAKTAARLREREVRHPLLHHCGVSGSGEVIYTSTLSPQEHWVLAEHRMQGTPVLPDSVTLEIARAAFQDHTGAGTMVIRDAYFLAPLAVPLEEKRDIRLILKEEDDGFRFSLAGREPGRGRWVEHSAGKIAEAGPETGEEPRSRDIFLWEPQCTRAVPVPAGFMPRRDTESMSFGPRWATVKKLRFGEQRALVDLQLPEKYHQDLQHYLLHPALLDMAVSCLYEEVKGQGSYLPFSYHGLHIYAPFTPDVNALVELAPGHPAGGETLAFRVTITGPGGKLLAEVDNFIMKRVAPGGTGPAPENLRLEIGEPGKLETLSLEPAKRPGPGPGEIEIEVVATGLNFKEVLFALGRLTPPPGVTVSFGLECTGRVSARGAGVTQFREGDEVVAFASKGFSRYTCVPETSAALKPPHISYEAAATIPVSFMTAYYSLVTLGRLQRGERVLIHSAAGGAGLAAVRIAQWIGAEVFATAGNPQKREYLAAQGIKHVMDSRSAEFARQVMDITGGEGVNVVLNSLSGEYIPWGLSVLAPYGRFLQLGVRDILENTPLGMGAFEKSIAFFAVSAGTEIPGFTQIFREMTAHIRDKHFEPLPYEIFPFEKTAQAFEQMARARHTGKLVVVHPDRLRREEGGGGAGGYGSGPLFPAEGIRPAEGWDVFRRVVNRLDSGAGPPMARVVVSTRHWPTRVRESYETLLPDTSGIETARPSGVKGPRPNLGTEFVPPANDIQRQTAALFEEFLALEKVGIHDNFFELGASSLDIIQVNNKLTGLLEKEISVVTLYTYPTVASLVEHLFPPAESTAALEEKKKRAEQEIKKSKKAFKSTIKKMKGKGLKK